MTSGNFVLNEKSIGELDMDRAWRILPSSFLEIASLD